MAIPYMPDEFTQRIINRHHWYVGLVVRSKMLDVLGRVPSNDEFAEHGRRIITPNGQETLMWDEFPLIRFSPMRFDQDKCKMVIDYER